MLAIGVVVILVFGLLILGDLRKWKTIEDCKAKGGTPIFVTIIQEMPIDSQGNSISQKYQAFERCQFGN
jgi:hypothetical protein